MRITRVIAVTIIGATFGLTSLQAQTLRKAAPPAEFPPASFKGKQYVDSRGCIYIRAGIDGNVTWVPRVARDRRQVCGYKPTAVAGGSTRSTTKQAAAPTVITNPSGPTAAPAKPKAQPKPKTAAATTVAAPKPKTTTTTRTTTTTTRTTTAPATTAARTTRKPVPTIATTTVAPKTQKTTRPVAPTTAIAPRTVPASNGCSNASSFSQQFINKKGVRCGPQAESPVTPGRGGSRNSSELIAPATSATGATTQVAQLTPNTRVVRRHVYQNRHNTTNVSVPKGYRPVWKDDRLNQHRAERTARPSVVSGTYIAPNGYRAVEREDDRLNPNRGVRTAAGDAQTDQIWQRTIPRSLIPLEQTPPVVTLPEGAVAYSDAASAPTLFRISTRSAPDASVAQAKPTPTATRSSWVRVATFKTDEQARQVAQSFASQGLPMRLGTVKRKGTAYRVVLAGPFGSSKQTQSALSQVRSAGYNNAKVSK